MNRADKKPVLHKFFAHTAIESQDIKKITTVIYIWWKQRLPTKKTDILIQTGQRLKQKNTAGLSMLYITMNNARTSYANVIYTAIEREYNKISQTHLLISVKAS